jgi:Pyruvate/2-oxoacid:ferredoxin oxidoreductase gamma subunit
MNAAARLDILVAGAAGQGALSISAVLAEAAAAAGYHVAQTGIYGAGVQFGNALGSVIISDTAIEYPYVVRADLLIGLSVDAVRAAIDSLKPAGLLIIDEEQLPVGSSDSGVAKRLIIPATMIRAASCESRGAVSALFVGAASAFLLAGCTEALLRRTVDARAGDAPGGLRRDLMEAGLRLALAANP